MRLVYQSFGQPDGMELYRAELNKILKQSVSPGTEIELRSLPSTILEGKGFASAQALEVPKLLSSIAAAVDAGAEGIAIGNGFDPGLWEARELFDTPILGWFETVALFALRVSWRVGVLCSGASGPSRIQELAARYGIAQRLARPQTVGVAVPEILDGFTNLSTAKRIVQSAEIPARRLAEEGAEVLIVTSGALDVMLQANKIKTLGGLAILPGVQILVRELEAAAALAQSGVVVASRVGRFRNPPQSIREALRK